MLVVMKNEFELPVASPCIRNCCLDSNDICLGCLRSLDEILQWGNASNGQRIEILSQVSQRKQRRSDKTSLK